jgi:hypothetical protein
MPHFTAIALAAAFTSPISLDLSGNYVVQGSCPHPASNSYRGTLRIQSQSNRTFYTLTWRIGEDTYVGSALLVYGRLVIEFRLADGRNGLMSMYQEDHAPTWHGLWAVEGTNILCSEAWQPQPAA